MCKVPEQDIKFRLNQTIYALKIFQVSIPDYLLLNIITWSWVIKRRGSKWLSFANELRLPVTTHNHFVNIQNNYSQGLGLSLKDAIKGISSTRKEGGIVYYTEP
jgi:hypothetical protein